MRLLEQLVDAAARAGAWACKIQSFFSEDLSGDWGFDRARVKSFELDFEKHRVFVQMCRARGITPMTSVYSFKYAQELYNAGFKYIKIGSPQATDADLQKRYRLLGFKLLISTGGHELRDIPKIGTPISAYLHCVSKYPSLPEEANLMRMFEIKKFWPTVPVGFSDHTDPTHPKWDQPAKLAGFLGASFIEKHFTVLDRSETKDGVVSVDATQLAELCRFDRLSPEDKLKEHPEWGIFKHPQTEAERLLISSYKGRWKKEIPNGTGMDTQAS